MTCARNHLPLPATSAELHFHVRHQIHALAMDVHELDQAFQEVVNASRGDSGAFEACWTAFCDLIGHDLEDQAGLVAEAVFGEEYVTVALKQSFINQRKHSCTAVFAFLTHCPCMLLLLLMNPLARKPVVS